MNTEEKFKEIKEMSKTLSQFISENDSKSLSFGIKESIVIDFLYENLKPILG